MSTTMEAGLIKIEHLIPAYSDNTLSLLFLAQAHSLLQNHILLKTIQ